MTKVKRFEVLNSWRGICAMMIVLYHFPAFFFFSDTALIRSNWLFVDFFFVLSGFVTTHGYANNLTTVGSALAFVRRRFFRLYPLHVCTLAAIIGWILLADISRLFLATQFPGTTQANSLFELPFEKIVAHVFLLQGFLGTDVGLNVPSWAVSVEFWTYIIFVICCLLLGKHLVFGKLVLTIICLFLLYVLSGREEEWYLAMIRCLAGFSMGSAVYLLMAKIKTNRLSVLFMTTLEGMVVAEVIALLWLISERYPLLWLSPIVFAQLVAVFSFEAGIMSRALNQSILTRAGIYSYSIYMVHTLMIGIMVAFLTALMRLGMPILGIPKLYILDIPKTLGTAVLIVFIGGLWYVARATYDRIERPGQTVLPDFVARLARRKPNLTY